MRGRLVACILALTLGALGTSAALVATTACVSVETDTEVARSTIVESETPTAPARRHVGRSTATDPQASPDTPVDQAETAPAPRRRHLRLTTPPRPEGWGELFVRDLRRDLHLRVDGGRASYRRTDLAPGMHSVALFLGRREIGRLVVAVCSDAVTQITLDEFRVDSDCLARFPSERLAPDRPGCRKGDSETDLGLRWLARHQSPSGLWSANAFDHQCIGNRCAGVGDAIGDTESTALALLTLLGAGETHISGEYKDVVRAGLKALSKFQDEDGWFGARREHAVATLAMTEAFANTESLSVRPSAKRAVSAMLSARSSTNAETAALEACALHSARLGGAWHTALLRDEPPATVDGHVWRALHHLRSFGPPEQLPPRQAALLLAARTLLAPRASDDDSPTVQQDVRAGMTALTRCVDEAIADGTTEHIDPLTLYCGTVCAWQLGESEWESWHAHVRSLVLDVQAECGSWEPGADDANERARDRLTTTAFHVLTGEVYYRYRRTFGGER